MDWAKIAKKVVGFGAPIIGRALLGPLGGKAGDILAELLGVEATPEAVSNQLEKMTPDQIAALDQEASEKFQAVADVLKTDIDAERDIAVANVSEVNATIRATAQGDGLLGKWRGVHAWELTLECFFSFILGWFCMIFRPESFQHLIEANSLISIYISARFGVLGVHVFQGSKERQTSIKELAGNINK